MEHDAPIRVAAPGDAPGLARAHVTSWRMAYRGVLPAAYLARLSVTQLDAWWRQVVVGAARRGDRVHVAGGGEDVTAFSYFGGARGGGARGGEGEIYMLYVHPLATGLGLGSRLMEAALDDLAARGLESCVVGVLEANTRARAFYARWGFAPDGGTRVDRLGGGRHVVLRYRRALGAEAARRR
ncbi:MAG: GNAT family N-acetyltransferase [Deltaproteobacteria bacterium]|nr:GNAT family N-acetyltransferase [Deltaproteobacteria bacterium]